MCSILSTIPQYPWTKPLNWDLHITWQGEPRIPFSIYVRPGSISSSKSPPCSAFQQFPKLPDELQLHMVQYCDISTLWQLMRVSSVLRNEAKKRFWSSDAWYFVDYYWILAGGFPGYAHHAVDILPYIEQVEVAFRDTWDLTRDWKTALVREYCPLSSDEMTESIQSFWQTLQYRLPRATRVLISQSVPSKAHESLPEEMTKLLEMCPSGITVSASLMQYQKESNLLERTLWRPVNEKVTTGPWEQVSTLWVHQSILLPSKDFRGPVGAYQRKYNRFNLYCMKRSATRPLLIEARERHQFGDGRCNPFDCFASNCTARFTQPGQWTLHALETYHDTGSTHRQPEVPIPEEVKEELKAHEISTKRVQQKDLEGHGENQPEAEQLFLEQLDQDPLYDHGRPGVDTHTWYYYKLTNTSSF